MIVLHYYGMLNEKRDFGDHLLLKHNDSVYLVLSLIIISWSFGAGGAFN